MILLLCNENEYFVNEENEENELPKFKIDLFSLPRNLCECNLSTYSCSKNTLKKDMWFFTYV
jgi:hypothetical protein